MSSHPFWKSAFSRLFHPFFRLFPFAEGWKITWKIQKMQEKGLFPQLSLDVLEPTSFKPPFAALQLNTCCNLIREHLVGLGIGGCCRCFIPLSLQRSTSYLLFDVGDASSRICKCICLLSLRALCCKVSNIQVAMSFHWKLSRVTIVVGGTATKLGSCHGHTSRFRPFLE